MTNLFIPKEIHVGFNNREDTYTKKLAYVIYTDESGKKRKETSWSNWKQDDIPVEDYPNEPTSGFVINKNVGGYNSHWNYRKSYIRVYDPRGFEFEITIENLLFILENTNSIVGKGLEGEFVYSWDGSDLVLLPVKSQDYIESLEYTKTLNSKKKIGVKDMVVGYTYYSKDMTEYVYLGRKKNNKTLKNAFWFLKKEKGIPITQSDIDELISLSNNRKNNIPPVYKNSYDSKGWIENINSVSQKFITLKEEIDTISLNYGGLLIKEYYYEEYFNKEDLIFKRKPLTTQDIHIRRYFNTHTDKHDNYFEFIDKDVFKQLGLHFHIDEHPFSNEESILSFKNNFDHSCTIRTRWYDNKEKPRVTDIKELKDYKMSSEFQLRFYNGDNRLGLLNNKNQKENSLEYINLLLKNNSIEKVEDKENSFVFNYTGEDIAKQFEIEEIYHQDYLIRKGFVRIDKQQ